MSWNGSTYQFLAEDGYQRAMGSMSQTVNEVANQRDNAMAALKKSEAAYGEAVNELEDARERLNAFAEHLRVSTETVISLKTENFNLKQEVQDWKESEEIQREVKLEVVQENNEQAETIKEQAVTIEALQKQCKFLKALLEEHGISIKPSDSNL